MPGVEKKVRKLLPEPKPQPKEEVVLKSGIVFFNRCISFEYTKDILQSLQNFSVSVFFLIRFPIYQNLFVVALKIKVIIFITFLPEDRNFVSVHSILKFT